MTPFADQPLEEQIAQWRAYLRRRQALHGPDVEELEGHLRDQWRRSPRPAWQETKRSWSRSSAWAASTRCRASSRASTPSGCGSSWSSRPTPTSRRTPARTEIARRPGLAVAAAVAVKVPALFGHPIDPTSELPLFYARNASLFVLPLLAVYFLWKRGSDVVSSLWLALPFAAGGRVRQCLPASRRRSHTEVLTALHLPIALWLVVGFAYVRGRWFADGGRMNFVRFSGELAIYYVLIALGGGVLTVFTVMMFAAIDLKPDWFIGGWLIPCGAAGAVIIGSWLVEAKQSVIENMAPVLTRLFTPLFTILLLAFLATMAWTGSPIDVKREVLIGFDLLLAVVVGLVLYAASARDPQAPPDFFDGLQLLLVISALVVDGVALAAIAARISEFGFTPNRVAALGENLILLVNLAWTARLYVSFVRRRGSFAALENWQIAYLPVYAVWAALVVVVFPPVFGYE